jgi:hypothetical protein
MKILIPICLLSLVLTSAGAGATPNVVPNKKPELPPRTIALEEQWTVGGEDGEYIFGMMIDSLEDEEGNIYMLDAQLCQVEVFSPDGEHLRTISGQGDGPGEVRIPQDLVLLPGGSLGILELFPAKFVTLQMDGVPGESINVGGGSGPQTGFSVGFQAACRGSSILIAAQRSTQSDNGLARTQYLARLDGSGQEQARFREQSVELNFSELTFVETELLPPFLLANAMGPDGRIYTPRSRDEYAIEVYEPDGTLAMVIERDFKPLKRDADSKRRFDALIDAWTTGFPGEVIKNIEENEPTIVDMHVDDEGILWVLHSRSGEDQPEGVFLTYDTFSPEGKWLQEVSFLADANPDFDGIRFLGEDHVLLIKGYVLARWASRGAQNADFGEDDQVGAMEISFCGAPGAP